MIIPFIPFIVFIEIGVIHALIYYLTNRLFENLKFGLSLYFTGLISGVVSYVIDWYGIYPVLHARTTEGFMMGIGLFLYMSWVVVPACYLIVLSVFYLIKRRQRKLLAKTQNGELYIKKDQKEG